jgi:hypothetical protein
MLRVLRLPLQALQETRLLLLLLLDVPCAA